MQYQVMAGRCLGRKGGNGDNVAFITFFSTQTKNGRSERLWCELDHDMLNMCPKPGVEVKVTIYFLVARCEGDNLKVHV